jgi:hypothetical protein
MEGLQAEIERLGQRDEARRSILEEELMRLKNRQIAPPGRATQPANAQPPLQKHPKERPTEKRPRCQDGDPMCEDLGR